MCHIDISCGHVTIHSAITKGTRDTSKTIIMARDHVQGVYVTCVETLSDNRKLSQAYLRDLDLFAIDSITSNYVREYSSFITPDQMFNQAKSNYSG